MSTYGVIQVRITDMPPADTPVTGQEFMQIVQYGRSRKLQLQDLIGFQTAGWSLKTGTYTAVSGDKIAAGSGGWSLFLPASPAAGANVEVADAVGWASSPITIDRNGSTIMGLSENLTLNMSDLSLLFVFNGSTWRVAE